LIGALVRTVVGLVVLVGQVSHALQLT